METENIYEEVLIKPGEDFQELFIVSGYASASFLLSHLTKLNKKYSDNRHKINLIIGMEKRRADHLAFLNIEAFFPRQFSGYYLDHARYTPCHSKVYAWSNGSKSIGFSGSANYSGNAFDSSKQVNQMSDEDGNAIKNFFDEMKDKSIPMEDYEFDIAKEIDQKVSEGAAHEDGKAVFLDSKTVQISFFTSSGKLPKASGLNHGHSKALKSKTTARDINDAYLPVRAKAKDEGFLPPIGKTFSLITDDEKSFDCKRTQSEGKAIQTTYSRALKLKLKSTANAVLGLYLRERLGLKSGSLVTKDDLLRYGRTDYVLRKIDNETIYFDFSV